jgi:hypothetical protein
MSWRKVATLVASLMIALAPWLESLEHWGEALSVQSMIVALPIIGGVVLAWLGSSPRFPTSHDGRKQF